MSMGYEASYVQSKQPADIAAEMNMLANKRIALSNELLALKADLKRLWHFAGCPFDHCQTCIDDAEWIKSLEGRLGPPSAASVMAQYEAR